MGIAALTFVGFLAAGAPAGSSLVGWAAAGAILAVGLVVAATTALRADLTMIPIALGRWPRPWAR